MLKSAYEGLNARPKVYLSKEYFCEMYPTCVSSKLCEFIYFLLFLHFFYFFLEYFPFFLVLVELSVFFLLISPMGNGHHLLRGFIMFRSLLFYFLLFSNFFYFFLEANVRLEKWGSGIWFGVEFVYSALHWLQHSIREAFKPLEATWYLVLDNKPATFNGEISSDLYRT